MKINTDIKNAVTVADRDAAYDSEAKRLLSNKIILAHIMAATIDEFMRMKPEDIAQHIEGEPVTDVVPTEPGLTNTAKAGKNGPDRSAANPAGRIVGLNTESAEINEGLIRFDIIFYARMKDGLSRIIINIELQKDNPAEYDILNRAVFYVSRMVSSQKERDFAGMNYNDIKRVFSIWICMGMKESSMNYVHLTNERFAGEYEWRGGLDLLNIVLIGIPDRLPKPNEGHELHRLLGTLLSGELAAEEKLKIIETEYNIEADTNITKGVSGMCNLSQGIREKGRKEGIAEGMAEGQRAGLEKAELSAVRNLMLKLKMTAEQAMDTLDIEAEKRAGYMALIGK